MKKGVTMSQVREDLFELQRRNFGYFIVGAFQVLHPGDPYLDNWHIEAMAWHLERGGNRVIISMPPRHLKSVVASVAYPAWLLGRYPNRRIICLSYGLDLTEKHARQCREVIESSWYRQIFPGTRISARKNSVLEFETTLGGVRFSNSVSGSLTGFGGDVIIIDDPLKAEEAMSESQRSAVNSWFDNTLLSRLNDKRSGRIVIVMQRLHQDDLVGHVLEKGGWSHLCLSAIAEKDESIQTGAQKFHERKAGEVLHEAREPLETLEEQCRQMGTARFSAQYQQDPLPSEGEIIKWSWFRVYEEQPSREPGDEIVQSWDTAFKDTATSDYSVCLTGLVRGNLVYVLDVLRKKLDYPSLKKEVLDHAALKGANRVLVENKGSGISLVADLQRGGAREDIIPIPVEVVGSKIERMSAQSAQIEAGHVLLPKDAKWLNDFRIELLQFPNGRYDDQADALSQLLAWVKDTNRFSFDFGYPVARERRGLSETKAPTPAAVRICMPDGKMRLWTPEHGYLDGKKRSDRCDGDN